MLIPETKYARIDDVNIAYQVTGSGEEYLIFIPGWCSNVEEVWNIPQLAAWLQCLGTFSKLVLFDKRGTGLSDRVNEHDLPDLEQRVKDLQALMNAIGIKKATLLGLSEGGAMALMFAHRYPQQVSQLILFGSFARWIKSEDYPFGLTREKHDRIKQYIFDNWGKPVGLPLMAPSVKDDITAQNQWATFLRRSGSPAAARALYEMNLQIDVIQILNKIKTPTLIMHRKNDSLIECGHSQYLYKKMPNAQLLITEGIDHLPWFNVQREEIAAIQTFLISGKAVTKKMEILNVEDIYTLYAIRNYILHHFRESFSIKSLSKQFGINVFKMKRGFRILFDNSVIGFLTDTRLDRACKLLGNPNETIASIADQVGYGYANNFSLAFKRKFGTTPQQYKANIDKSMMKAL
jgi:pimeloyl-ACP methyl ester carboxylesterase